MRGCDAVYHGRPRAGGVIARPEARRRSVAAHPAARSLAPRSPLLRQVVKSIRRYGADPRSVVRDPSRWGRPSRRGVAIVAMDRTGCPGIDRLPSRYPGSANRITLWPTICVGALSLHRRSRALPARSGRLTSTCRSSLRSAPPPTAVREVEGRSIALGSRTAAGRRSVRVSMGGSQPARRPRTREPATTRRKGQVDARVHFMDTSTGPAPGRAPASLPAHRLQPSP